MVDSVREFQGILYRLLSKEDVREYVLSVAKAEWEPEDFDNYGRELLASAWELREIDVEKIKPNRELFASPTFRRELDERIEKVKSCILNAEPIPPLILRGSDLFIFDGCARYSLFIEIRIAKCLAYIGESSGNA